MSDGHNITLDQAHALCETTGAYDCALFTGCGIAPPAEAPKLLQQVTLDDGRVVATTAGVVKHFCPTVEQVHAVALLARALHAELAFHDPAFAEVISDAFIAADIRCQWHEYDEPWNDFRAVIVFAWQ